MKPTFATAAWQDGLRTLRLNIERHFDREKELLLDVIQFHPLGTIKNKKVTFIGCSTCVEEWPCKTMKRIFRKFGP